MTACAAIEGARSLSQTLTRRAGPALPSYLALHHAGFSVPALLLARRWALTPPFHPYQTLRALRDVPQVSLRDATVLRAAGGLFSVALSVASPLQAKPPGVTRRVALSRVLADKNISHASGRCPDFPPAADLAIQRPAITRPARYHYHNPISTSHTEVNHPEKLIAPALRC